MTVTNHPHRPGFLAEKQFSLLVHSYGLCLCLAATANLPS